MFYIACLVPLAVSVSLAMIANQQRLGLRGLAFHPFNLLGFFIVITTIDFMTAHEMTLRGESIRSATYSEYTPGAVWNGLAFFILCSLAILFGCFLGSRGKGRLMVDDGGDADQKAAFVVAAGAFGLAAFTVLTVVGVALARGSIGYVAGIKGVFFRDNAILYVLYSMLLPAFYLYGSRVGRWNLILTAYFVAVLLLLPIGSRGSIAMLTVGLLFWASRHWRIPVAALYVFSPVVAIGLTYYRWATRESAVYNTFGQFLDAHDGLAGALFNTPDISMAEAITINVNQDLVHRMPWDSILGVLLIPVPRSIAPFKPFGASTEFTQQSDLARWLTVKAEWTVTGFVNLLMDFGYVIALFATFGLAYWWSITMARRASSQRSISFAAPVLIYFMYVFYRGDIYNLGTAMWPAGLVVIAHTVATRIFKSAKAKPAVGRAAVWRTGA